MVDFDAPTSPKHSQTIPTTFIFPTHNDPIFNNTPRGQNKLENFKNCKLKNINSYNATYPNPYYGKKHSQCIKKIPEYRHQSLNEDINQTRICKVTKPKHDTPRGQNKIYSVE